MRYLAEIHISISSYSRRHAVITEQCWSGFKPSTKKT